MPPVRLIGVDQRRSDPTLVDGGELVGEVVNVTKPGVEP